MKIDLNKLEDGVVLLKSGNRGKIVGSKLVTDDWHFHIFTDNVDKEGNLINNDGEVVDQIVDYMNKA